MDQKNVKVGPINVSQALVKCSRGETYDFKTIFRVSGPRGAKQKPILGGGVGWGGGGVA